AFARNPPEFGDLQFPCSPADGTPRAANGGRCCLPLVGFRAAPQQFRAGIRILRGKATASALSGDLAHVFDRDRSIARASRTPRSFLDLGHAGYPSMALGPPPRQTGFKTWNPLGDKRATTVPRYCTRRLRSEGGAVARHLSSPRTSEFPLV